MNESGVPTLKQNIQEANEPIFLKNERFLEFIESKEIDLEKYKNNFIDIWEFPVDLYVEFHNSFNYEAERVIRNLKSTISEDKNSNRDKLTNLIVKLLETLEPHIVGQLLKVFREIKRNDLQ